MPARPSSRARASAIALAVAVLSGCAHQAVPTPIAEAPPPPPPARPLLAEGYGSILPPARLPDGGYATINAGIDAQRTVWHLRAALNVAAIGCRAPEDAGITPAYNMLLTSEKRALAAANASVEASFKAQGGDWRSAHDRYMTRLYNFFAMPAAKVAFCEAARGVAPEAVAATPAAFPAFAAGALPRLEAPFNAVYAAIDDWKVQTAAWDARYGPGAVQMAQAVPVTPAVPASPSIAAPQLRYADMATVLAWTPDPLRQLAAR